MNSLFLLAAFAGAAASPDLPTLLDELRIAQDVPGVSAVVIRDDTVLFSGASGFADIESATPMSTDTKLYIGSLSKVLTAVLVLQLVETQRLGLDDPVPGIALGRPDAAPPVRVSHLLSHSAGLDREGDFNYWYTTEFPDAGALDRYLETTQLLSVPGAGMHYSNIAYGALGRVIERTLGQSYGDALRSRVLEPLHMNATGAPGPAADIANGYTPPNRLLPDSARPFAGVGRRVGDRHVRLYHDARAMSPAFGAYASARDLGTLARFLLGHGGDTVLSRRMRLRMREPQSSGWGLGLKLQAIGGRPVARHDGWFAAHRSHVLLDADSDIAVVVLANSDSASPQAIAEALYAAALRQ